MSREAMTKLMADIIEAGRQFRHASEQITILGGRFDDSAQAGRQVEAEKFRDMIHTQVDIMCDAKMAGLYAISELEKLEPK